LFESLLDKDDLHVNKIGQKSNQNNLRNIYQLLWLWITKRCH